ncbi:MAG: SpoIIE family protein phosphatase [Lentisphaeria bacterium]|nr:SpoIIE family protein phosphatase [Lentisphaeria bacterium]
MKITLATLILFLLPFAVLLIMCVVQRMRLVLLRQRLSSAMHNTVEMNHFLSLFSRNLKGGQNFNEWMNITARYVAERVDARSVCIFLRSGEVFKAAGISGLFPLVRKSLSLNYAMTKPKYLLEQLKGETFLPGDGIIGEVAQTGRDIILENAMDDPRVLSYEPVIPVDCLMAVPLINEGEVVGVMCAVNTTENERDSFSADQIARFKFIATQVLLAQNVLDAYSHLAEQQRLSQELNFARVLQQSLLPQSMPVWGRFSIHAFTRASKEVSGDFYDFVELDDNRLMVIIGDACGKGIPACMVMTMTRSYIRANIKRFTSLKEFLSDLNDNLYKVTGDERYVTLACCILNKVDFTIEYARAGHTELMLFIRDHLRSFYPDGSGIGLLPSEFTSFDTFRMDFTPGMRAFLFTDGLNEATNARDHKEEFGVTRLRTLFQESCRREDTPDEFFNRTLKEIESFAGYENGESQEDDLTMVLIRHL